MKLTRFLDWASRLGAFSSSRIITVAFVLCTLMTACGSSRRTGTVAGAAIEEGQIVTVVKLDNGTEVKAIPMTESGMVQLVGGQKVEVEPGKGSKLWKVVRILEANK